MLTIDWGPPQRVGSSDHEDDWGFPGEYSERDKSAGENGEDDPGHDHTAPESDITAQEVGEGADDVGDDLSDGCDILIMISLTVCLPSGLDRCQSL